MPITGGLRRGVLAVSVLRDLDLVPADDGILLPGDILVEVSWAECERALVGPDGGADPESEQGRERLARWLLGRRRLADLPAEEIVERARPVGLPSGHPAHPGPDWVAEAVLGGCLHLGLGLLGLDPAAPERVDLLPGGLLAAAALPAGRCWAAAAGYLRVMGRLAAERWLRDPSAALRPMGDCDVVTLLGSAAFRRVLAGGAGGMCAVAAPMRNRGWTDLRRIDPAFVIAAAAATPAADRGFPRAVLLTADEVVLAAANGRPAQIVLRDPAVDEPWRRPVPYT